MQTSRRILRRGAWAVLPLLLLPAAGFARQHAPAATTPVRADQAAKPGNSGNKQPGTLPPQANLAVIPAGENVAETILVSRMHMINQLEIAAGQLAMQRGSTAAVRAFGNRLQRDHQMGDHRVLAYANAHKLSILPAGQIEKLMQEIPQKSSLPETSPQQMKPGGAKPAPPELASVPPSPEQALQQQVASAKATMEKLHQLHGMAFDDAFTQFMVQGHTQAIALLSLAQHRLPQGNGLRSLLNNLIPILQQHYEIAAALRIATIRQQNAELGDQLGQTVKGGL